MARKRRKAVSEDLRLPDFDEKSYIKLEMRGAVFLIACVGMSLVMSLVAGFLTWGLKDGRIAFVLGLLGFFLVRLLLSVLKVDMSDFDKMRWASGFFTYFLTFIAVWILLINPPLANLIPPKISDNTTDDQELGAIVNIAAYIDDSQRIKSVDVILTDPHGVEIGPFKMNRVIQNLYSYRIENPIVGVYNYTIEVRDDGGYFKDANFKFTVKENLAPTIAPYPQIQGQNITRGSGIHVIIKDNVGVILAFYGLDQPPEFQTLPTSSEVKLALDNPQQSEVVIPTDKWAVGPHNMTICALDRVPHRETCDSYQFNLT